MVTALSDNEFKKGYIEEIKQFIDLKDLGEAETVLGMQVIQEDGKLYVHQKEYIKKLLGIYGMEDCDITDKCKHQDGSM